MYQPSTNITQKYRQETRYNYMGNSGFVAQIAFFFVLRFCAIVSLVLHLPHKFLRKRYRKQKNKIRNCLISITVDRYVGILFLPVS